MWQRISADELEQKINIEEHVEEEFEIIDRV